MKGITVSKNIREKAGVYAIWNKTNSKIYIGSSRNMKGRIASHLNKLNNNKHSIKALQSDFNRGDDFLIFKVLEVENIKNLRYYEEVSMICFDSIKNGYNSQAIADREPIEVNNIRILAGNLDYFIHGADEEEKNDIIEKIINN